MIYYFKKKKILITGSSSGIGFGLAKKFSELNSVVILNGKNLKKLKKKSKLIKNSSYVCADITNKKSLKKMISKIKLKYKNIDILICNLGQSNFKKNNLNFEHAFKMNFFSTLNTINLATPILKKNGGKILCISSICGFEKINNAPLGYSLAKSSLNSYVKLISGILSKKGITINSIAPGNILFKGSTWEKHLKKNHKKTSNYIKENVPQKKFGTIDDVTNLCVFLSSDKSNFITGSTYVIDGGQTKKLYQI